MITYEFGPVNLLLLTLLVILFVAEFKLINNIMFVSQLRRSISAFSRFKRPVFRNINNPNQLLLDTRSILRQLKIENANR